MEIIIEGKKYKVNNNEYNKINHQEYTNLRLYNEIGIHERIIGFIKKCIEVYIHEKPNFISFNTTHGGFIQINLSNFFDKIIIVNTKEEHLNNINYNIEKHKINNIINEVINKNNNIIYSENIDEEVEYYLNNDNIILITKEKKLIQQKYNTYSLSGTNYYINVNEKLQKSFNEIFSLYIGEKVNGIINLNFDNLIHLCIMVKNGGPQFEQMLTDNLPIIDKWTILDTGSTDETIDIINRILVGKKDGKLYQEPFINFKDSRNRLIDLAGNDCKYKIMLDDTYVIQGNLRNFLTEIRSDQYSNSFTLFILSDDTKYGSNRIIKSNSDLKYVHRIHEVITDKNNINVVIPENKVYIDDRRFDYMEKRTRERKQLDLKLLFEEVEENPNDPRAYYYLAQTYNILEDYEKAYFYFMKRCEFVNAGFLQERVDAAFEAARVANFKLNKPWEECEKLYNDCYKIDESRPESLYFIGIHYYLENNYQKAFWYLKKGFEIGFPQHCQYSLKPTLTFHFLPKFLTKICYFLKEYEMGEKASNFFLQNNTPTAENYQEILSWYQIFVKLNIYKGPKIPKIPQNPIICFVADGGFNPWTGSTILTSGVGGSETYIIEMARYIKQSGNFEVYVFCNTPNENKEIFEGVIYCHLNKYYEFINTNYVNTCIVSRFSEYLPVTFTGFSENVYLVVHDLTPSGIVIPKDYKLKNIFCLTEWHSNYLKNIFPTLQDIIKPFNYGIDDRFKNKTSQKIKNKFIYSSFPNRGLLQLLQMWPKIYEKEPSSTLYIYADVNNKWSNDVEPQKMNEIKKLLQEYKERNNRLGIHYCGWVGKKELAEAWLSSDFWFYPCTFMETFCLTALEAASSKTFVITNNLAALQDTVGNRGEIISGDTTTQIWQEKALQKVFYYMDEKNKSEKEKFININYEWSLNLSWEKQANKLLDTYIYPNNIFEYKGMYNWTNDLPNGSKKIFKDILYKFVSSYLKIQFQKQINVLEIGTYSGISLIEIIKCIPNSFGIGLDLWSSYDENNLLTNMDNLKVKDSFYKNIKTSGLENRIKGIQIDSKKGLIQFIKDGVKFDFIYVDGSHLLLDAYTDIVLSWEILEKGGYIIIDNYFYKKDEPLKRPFEAVNHFLKLYKGQYNILSIDYCVFLEKKLLDDHILNKKHVNIVSVVETICSFNLYNKNDYHILKIGAFKGNVPNDTVYHNINSNTKVIFVEPVPTFYYELKENYNNKFNNNQFVYLNEAISDKNEKLQIYYPSKTNNFNQLPWWIEQIASSNIQHCHDHGYKLDLDVININAITVKQIIELYNIQMLFCLMIDTEGSDFKILMNIDFSTFKPIYIIFENMHLTSYHNRGENYNILLHYLSQFGYKIIDENESDTLMTIL